MAAQGSAIQCPVMGGPADAKAGKSVYQGVAFSYCCAGCDTTFAKDPKKFVAKAAKGKGVIGVSEYDPVSRARTEVTKFVSDFQGIRYGFQSEANKAAFDANPKKFAAAPEKEVFSCAVMGSSLEGLLPSGYADVEGVRYYFCCGGCDTSFAKDPAKYTANLKGKAVKAVVRAVKVK